MALSKSWKAKFDRFRHLSSSERRLLALVWLGLPLVELSLRRDGLNRTQRRLVWLANRLQKKSQGPSHSPDQIVKLLNLALRYTLLRPRCLGRTLTLQWLLEIQGLRSEMRLGVRYTPTGLEAHAWLEYQGRVLNDRPEMVAQFRAFDRAITLTTIETLLSK